MGRIHSLIRGSSTFNVEHRDTKQDSGLMKARLRAAIRIGLYRAVPFSAAIALGGGMEVREKLGPSLQACSVVLSHSPEHSSIATTKNIRSSNASLAQDFFHQRLRRLQLSGRPLTLIACSHLADALDHNRALNQLVLDKASLGDDAVSVLTTALIRDADPDLEILSLRGNAIGREGAEQLARAMQLNQSITSLHIKPNPCHYDVTANEALGTALLGGNAILEQLNGFSIGFNIHRATEALYESTNVVVLDQGLQEILLCCATSRRGNAEIQEVIMGSATQMTETARTPNPVFRPPSPDGSSQEGDQTSVESHNPSSGVDLDRCREYRRRQYGVNPLEKKSKSEHRRQMQRQVVRMRLATLKIMRLAAEHEKAWPYEIAFLAKRITLEAPAPLTTHHSPDTKVYSVEGEC